MIERFILSLKNECTRVIFASPHKDAFRQELTLFSQWYNQGCSHSALDGKTPQEVYHGLSPACQRPRFEPRVRWPRTARCASPQAPVASSCSARIRFEVRYHWGRAHLPIVALRRAA